METDITNSPEKEEFISAIKAWAKEMQKQMDRIEKELQWNTK